MSEAANQKINHFSNMVPNFVLFIRIGDVIYSEPAYVSVISTRHIEICHNCISTSESTQRCSRCKIARYCSVRCQSAHWAVHKEECNRLCLIPRALESTKGLDVDSTSYHLTIDNLLFAYRLLTKFVKQELDSSNLPKDVDNFREIAAMHRQWALYSTPESAAEAANFFSLLRMMLPESFDRPLSFIQSHVEAVSRNSFSIVDSLNRTTIGSAVYPSASLFNHSCCPNAWAVFDKTRIKIVAIDHIQPDTEIFISYLDGTESDLARSSTLKYTWGFECSCPRCIATDAIKHTFPPNCSKQSCCIDIQSLCNTANNMDPTNPQMKVICKQLKLLFSEYFKKEGIRLSWHTHKILVTLTSLESLIDDYDSDGNSDHLFEQHLALLDLHLEMMNVSPNTPARAHIKYHRALAAIRAYNLDSAKVLLEAAISSMRILYKDTAKISQLQLFYDMITRAEPIYDSIDKIYGFIDMTMVDPRLEKTIKAVKTIPLLGRNWIPPHRENIPELTQLMNEQKQLKDDIEDKVKLSARESLLSSTDSPASKAGLVELDSHASKRDNIN